MRTALTGLGPSALEGRVPLIRLSAALGSRDDVRLEAAMRDALDAGLAAEAEEVLVQSYLFVGFPLALNAVALWRRKSGREAPPPREETGSGWVARGERVLAAVYGPQHARLRANVQALHPDLERWMVAEGYGKVLGREGLDLAIRELTIVALLAVWDVPRQLYSHLRGALQVGATEADVEDTLRLAMEYVATATRRDAVERVWKDVKERAAASHPMEEDAQVAGHTRSEGDSDHVC